MPKVIFHHPFSTLIFTHFSFFHSVTTKEVSFFQSPVSPFCPEPPSLLLDPVCQCRNIVWKLQSYTPGPHITVQPLPMSHLPRYGSQKTPVHAATSPVLSEPPVISRLPNPTTFLPFTLSSASHHVQALLCGTSLLQLSRYPVFLCSS